VTDQEAIQFQGFLDELPFSLSAYQHQALAVMMQPGQSAIVVAPTGSGKSVVADAAVWQALREGGTAIYTSPLRALANQRFEQLAARWGDRAGLITGDTSIRPQAPVRVMTTEVYRLLALLPAETGVARGLGNLRWAIFDEAHYLSDPERGAIWEEAILATPPQTRILCLSATIGAPERLARWLRWLGRDVALIETDERPVPLRHMLALRGDLHLVMDEHGSRVGRFPLAGGWALAQRRGNSFRTGAGPMRRRYTPPPPGLPSIPPIDWIRQEAVGVLGLLREHDLTPTITFTSGRREAELLAEAAKLAFPEDAAGVAFHHAGLHPIERRRVEEALRRGEVWLVCSTTTLAAGLDVPARSVLVTSFGRFDGKSFSLFTPAEYRQLAGRAGRLGKDVAGAVVLLASPWHSFEEAFQKLTAPLPPVDSAFRPSYATALAWWSGRSDAGILADRENRDIQGSQGDDGGQRGEAQCVQRLAMALSRTFAAYLRRSRGGKGSPVASEPDSASLQEARILGRLLVLDGLVTPEGSPTARGRFVLHVSGGPEGRLLLRLLESGALERMGDAERIALLALLAGETATENDIAYSAYQATHREQIEQERMAGASLTPPLSPRSTRPSGRDEWRQRQAAADLLERALRATRRSGLDLSIHAWGEDLLQSLTKA
jgi:ATP-dependent RNA helicase HelY